MERMSEQYRDVKPAAEFCRVKDLVPPHGPFSRAQIFRYLSDRRLRARRLGRVLLIDVQSVRELLDSAEPWRLGGR